MSNTNLARLAGNGGLRTVQSTAAERARPDAATLHIECGDYAKLELVTQVVL